MMVVVMVVVDQGSGLFSGLEFYLYGCFGHPSAADLELLIIEGGGWLIRSAAILSSSSNRTGRGRRIRTVVLCDPKVQMGFETDASLVAKHRPLVASTWILDCISAFKLVDQRTYAVL